MIDVKLEVTNLINPLIEALETIYKAGRDFFEIGVKEYLQNTTEKMYLVNTFYHQEAKVKLFDIYHPLVIYNKERVISFSVPYMDFAYDKHIAIVGRAGAGKSLMMKYLFVNSITYRFKIPFIVELRYFNEYETSLEDYVIKKLLFEKIKSSQKILDLGLKRGNFIFLIDGYDEIYRNRKFKIRTQIVEFMDRFPNNIFVITSRPGGGVETIPRFRVYKIKPLTKNDIISLIKRIELKPKKRRKIIKDIQILTSDNKIYNIFRNYLSNPLLLSMFLKTYKYFPEIPSTKQIFYRNVFDTLYSRHDAVDNDGLRRQRYTGFKRVELEKFLNAFCYVTYFKRELVFDTIKLSNRITSVSEYSGMDCEIDDMIYDLRTSIGVLVQDGATYTFPHRSLQEYFCVLFVSKLETEQKKKAYSKYLDLLTNNPDYGEYNFWELSSEIDNVSFVEHFLVPYLEELISKLERYDIVRNFLEQFNIQWFCERKIHEKYIAVFNPKDIPNYPPGEYEFNNDNERALKEYIKKSDIDLEKNESKSGTEKYEVLVITNDFPLIYLKFNESALPFKILSFVDFNDFSFLELINLNEDENSVGYSIGRSFPENTKIKEIYQIEEEELDLFVSRLSRNELFIEKVNELLNNMKVKLHEIIKNKESISFSVDRLLDL